MGLHKPIPFHYEWIEINQKKFINIATYVPTCWALADKAADLVQTFTLVQTGGAETLIHLYLTMSPLKSCMHGEKQVLIISSFRKRG